MYRFHPTNGVILVATGEYIPAVKSDPRWADYKAWTKAGNTALPSEPELEPLQTILARLASGINQERGRRHDLPITCQDVQFDADAEARENISGTISRLLRGDGLPANWVGWRAYDNSMHWSDIAPDDVLTHLRALSSKIEDRKQRLFIIAWVKKSEIEALYAANDRQALTEYDIMSGWPEL
jgi:hypothetical protein